MGSIWSGELTEARAAAAFLRVALDSQPALAEEFHAYLDLEGQVVPDRSDRNAFFSLSDPFARPALYATGVSGLVWLARASGEKGPLDTADTYIPL